MFYLLVLANVLLAVIAYVSYVAHRERKVGASKKRHYEKALITVKKQIWDLEFQRNKLKHIREDIRQQYDRTNEHVQQLKAKLEAEQAKDDTDAKVVEQLTAQIKQQEPDLEGFKSQIQSIDEDCDGEGADSKKSQLEGLRALETMIKEEKKKV